MAIKIMENIGENLEEIEEEYLILRDLSLHPNLPSFHGIFFKKGSKQEEDQAWLVMEVRGGRIRAGPGPGGGGEIGRGKN